MQAHARMSALIKRRIAFIRSQLEFQLFHGRSDTRRFVKKKVRGGFSELLGTRLEKRMQQVAGLIPRWSPDPAPASKAPSGS